MSIEEFVSLDWRSAPSSSEIVKQIEKLFTTLDEKGTVSLCLSNSKAKSAICLVEQGDDAIMIRRRENLTVRKINTVANRQYFYALWEIAKTLIGMQIEQQALKARFIAYKDVSPKLGMKLDRLKRLMLDLALTLKIHPIALGIKGEASGQIHIPKHVRLETKLITNLFHYLDRNKEAARPYSRNLALTTGTSAIPEPILSLDVKMERTTKPPGRIDAVIAVEHRNLTEVILQESLDVKDVIIIMTAGFPDSATKEILHLLSTNKRMERTPFLYFGDHDTAGYTIFQCLKYGSRTSAWVPPISVCPQLVYAGPTIEDLKASAARFRSHWEVQYKEGKPNATDAQVKTAADTWQKTTEQQITDKLTSLTSKDKQTLTSFKKLGWLAHEDVIQGEIAAMEKGKGVFRFANLAQAGTYYVQQYMEKKVVQYCPQRVTVSTETVPAGSPAAQIFRSIDSQSLKEQSGNAVSQAGVESTTQTDTAASLELDANREEMKQKCISRNL